MSYDLTVVLAQKPGAEAISNWLAARRGEYSLQGLSTEGPSNANVYAKKRDELQPIFSLDGPLRIEVDDVDEAVLEFLLAPQWQFELSLPASSSLTDQKLAKTLATWLAKHFQGAVYDPQRDDVIWPKKRPQWYRFKRGAETIDVVTLKWQFDYERREPATAILLIRLIRKYFYEALPKRFGCFEPLQGKVDDDDFSGFFDAWAQAIEQPYGELLHMSATAPCFGGSISFSDPRDDTVRNEGAKKVAISFDFDGRALRQALWRDAVVRFFTGLARELGAFYAIAYVECGVNVSGNRLGYSASSETYPLPRSDRWLGIPPVPGWLLWFGPPYMQVLKTCCAAQISESFPEGFLLRSSLEPASIDSLSVKQPEFPAELLARLSDHTRSGHAEHCFNANATPSRDAMEDQPAEQVFPQYDSNLAR